MPVLRVNDTALLVQRTTITGSRIWSLCGEEFDWSNGTHQVYGIPMGRTRYSHNGTSWKMDRGSCAALPGHEGTRMGSDRAIAVETPGKAHSAQYGVICEPVGRDNYALGATTTILVPPNEPGAPAFTSLSLKDKSKLPIMDFEWDVVIVAVYGGCSVFTPEPWCADLHPLPTEPRLSGRFIGRDAYGWDETRLDSIGRTALWLPRKTPLSIVANSGCDATLLIWHEATDNECAAYSNPLWSARMNETKVGDVPVLRASPRP